MPMYFPDLRSVKVCAETMAEHQLSDNKYKGIIPETESDLPEARRQLGQYMRDIWHDEIAALEIELAVDENDYEEKLSNAIIARQLRRL
ncbi:hypothetical protein LCGC14_2600900 [marine sediment metagenome]|uniref:Uncharacterized protein n=1 Tax=marine sediment metagenome TaxID=412755 RepID=A0A0F9AWH3_9ZZZZ